MEQKVREKTYKQMLWVSIVSMIMMFAGLTSAYLVSQNRDDWVSFEVPSSFFISTLLILLSSATFFLAKKYIKNDDRSKTSVFLVLTLILGGGFIFYQFQGFQQLVGMGLYLTGKESNVSTSFLYVITMSHLAHIFAGILVVTTVLVQNIRGKYNSTNYLGLKLGSIFWHFVDVLWIFLILFFYFIS